MIKRFTFLYSYIEGSSFNKLPKTDDAYSNILHSRMLPVVLTIIVQIRSAFSEQPENDLIISDEIWLQIERWKFGGIHFCVEGLSLNTFMQFDSVHTIVPI